MAAQEAISNPATPTEVRLSPDRRQLTLIWSEYDRSILASDQVRGACRCAWCTRDRVLDQFPTSFEGVGIADLELIGGHAVHIIFSDGHARGVFPWVYLRDVSQGERTARPERA